MLRQHKISLEQQNKLKVHKNWVQANTVLEKLKSKGYIAYLAGGAVRDLLLDRPINDFDVATSATPEEVCALFDHTIDIGKDFGVAIVVVDHVPIEVTRFRLDEDYKDGRRPGKVQFTNVENDSKRRDFTINALYIDSNLNTILDFHKGVDDLQAKVLVTVGDAEERFKEDHLRLMRCFRFQAQLGFQIEPTTLRAIYKLRHLILDVSKERFLVELSKIIEAPYSLSAINHLFQFEILQTLFLIKAAEQTQYQILLFNNYNLFISFKKALSLAEQSTRLNFFTLLFLFNELALKAEGDGSSRFQVKGYIECLKKLKLPSLELKKIQSNILTLCELEEIFGYKKTLKTLAERLLLLSKQKSVLVNWKILIKVLKIDPTTFELITKEYAARELASGSFPQPYLNGNDLKGSGLLGARIGQALKEMYLYQIENKIDSKDILLKALQTYLKSLPENIS